MARKARAGKWSMKTDRELIQMAKSRTLEAIADQLQRSPDYILKRAARLGLSIKGEGAGGMTPLWTEAETRRLRVLVRKKVTTEDIARSLHRHAGSVKKKVRELSLIPLKKMKSKGA